MIKIAHHLQTWPLMMGFEGTDPKDEGVQQLLSYLEKGLVAGIIFFAHNLTSPDQTQKLVRAFQEAAPSSSPLLAIDQEGGKVQRLSSKNGFLSFPSAFDLADTHDLDETLKVYQDMAKQNRKAGFNYVFGPVVDLHHSVSSVIGGLERAYSPDPEKVVLYAKAFIEAHRQEGILTCLKHFPGHGLAAGDTHQGWVDITNTFQEKETTPFKKLIAEGKAETIMASHLFHQKWDNRFPVSLSDKTMATLLRDELEYDGVVVTDDLHMGAIGKHFSLETTILQAIKAQNDLLVFSGNPAASGGKTNFDPQASLPEILPTYIQQFLSEGEITKESIESSWRRLDRLKGVFLQS